MRESGELRPSPARSALDPTPLRLVHSRCAHAEPRLLAPADRSRAQLAGIASDRLGRRALTLRAAAGVGAVLLLLATTSSFLFVLTELARRVAELGAPAALQAPAREAPRFER